MKKRRRKKISEKRKKIIGSFERQILKVLMERKYYLNTTQVAEIAHTSWNTAEHYLKRMHNKNWVKMKTTGNRKLWSAYNI
ncbi:MAG: BlaI/MecI/CopY family transcriptional regulator [archaeon]